VATRIKPGVFADVPHTHCYTVHYARAHGDYRYKIYNNHLGYFKLHVYD